VAVNPYFSFNQLGNHNEQFLIENLLEESIKMYGMDVKYIQRNAVDLDTLFGEAPLSMFERAFDIEMYFDNPQGFTGDKTFISKFVGLSVSPSAVFMVSKRRFSEVLKPDSHYQDVRPLEGDLLYVPMTKDFWEIKFVDHETPFFQLMQVGMWKLSVEKFVYSSERMSTGIDELDRLETNYSHDGSIPDTDGLADNEILQTEANTSGDFTDEDPFSEGEYHA